MTNNTTSNKAEAYRKQESKDEMKKQLISFGMMIAFTIIAFALVGTDVIQGSFLTILLFVLAFVQMMFQFLYFMHMKDKGHAEASGIIYGGFWVTFLVMLGLGVISWW
ncbi:cytochrome C oxidase subunit IV family protein [Oceanobacillus luteolus]|uniref:Cytochrome C oxidase subunit IV family protein n=1 Tax=Oceanobacillus luteolus TaxID=1274358 RepID=A0ABW4HQY0_9BACI|nr:cytochrome C oxidase subunit IV family protein [Oceanobacillus luteolus]MCM3742257.1 cytochrome C oxidase subunit IV family protein [Oceanobacillus luteolus]